MKSRLLLLQILSFASNSVNAQDCSAQTITGPKSPYIFGVSSGGSKVHKSTNTMATDFVNSDANCLVNYRVFTYDTMNPPTLTMENASMTDNENLQGAEYGIDGTQASVRSISKINSFWKAEVQADADNYVETIRVSLVSAAASSMSNVAITVGGVACGSLEANIADGTSIAYLSCAYPLLVQQGTEIQMTQPGDAVITFEEMIVYGYPVSAAAEVDSDGYLAVTESAWSSAGMGGPGGYVYAILDNGNSASGFMVLQEVCGTSTTVDNTSPYTFSLHAGGFEQLLSDTTTTADFTNDDDIMCQITITLEKNDGNALDGGLENLISINSDNKVLVNEAFYDGTSVSVRVKATTDYESVYKTITIENRCGTLTSAVLSDPDTSVQGASTFNINRQQEENFNIPMSTFFSNSDEANCHYFGAYSFVTESDVSQRFISMLPIIVDNDEDELATAALTVQTRNWLGQADDIVFKIKYVTWYDNFAPLYYTITLRDSCNSQTFDPVSADAQTFSATRLLYESPFNGFSDLISVSTVADYFTNSAPAGGCAPATYSLVDQAGGALDTEVSNLIGINLDLNLVILQGKYLGGEINVQVKAVGEFTEGFKAIKINEECGKQTIGLYDSSLEVCGVDDKCTGYRGKQTKTRDGSTCTPWMEGVWNSDLNEDPTQKIYRSSGLDDNYCRNPEQVKEDLWCPTVGAEGDQFGFCDILSEDAYTLEAVKQSDQTVLSSTKPKDDFTNSNPSGCPITFSIVDSEGEELEADVAAFISINADGDIAVNEASYPGGIDLSLQVKAITDFGTPVYKALNLHEKCPGQTVTVTESVYALEAVRLFTGTVESQTQPSNDFENSNALACPITFSIVDSEGDELEADVAAFISINEENGLIQIDESAYPGGVDLSLQVKAITEFGTPVFKTITVHEICGRQTLTAIDSSTYSLEARKLLPGIVSSTTKPEDDITNSDPSVCPTTWSIVNSEGEELEADVAAFISINADAISVDESKYPGGIDLSLQVKAITDFGTPVFKALNLHEKCPGQTVTVTESVYALEAVKLFTGTVESQTQPSIDFENSNALACPITFSIVDSEGDELEADVAAFISINEDNGLIQIDESAYPGGVDLSLQVKAITEFGTPVFKTITVHEHCGRQTLTASDSSLVYILEARRELAGLVLSSSKPEDNFTNSNTLACPITWSIVDSEGSELEADVAAFIQLNDDGLIQVDESQYPGKDLTLRVKAVTEFGTIFYHRISIIEICGRQAHTVDSNKVYDIKAIAGKPGLVLSTTKPEDDITNNDPSVCPTTWSIVQTNGEALSAEIQTVLSINSDGFVQVNQENFDGVNFEAQVKAINPVFNEPVFSDITITRQWLCREQTRTVSGGDFNFDPEFLISDSACVESCTSNWQTCSANSDQNCFTLTEKVTNLGDWDSTYQCALTDDNSFDNFLVAFTSNVANLQRTFNVLPEAQQNEVITCMKQVPQATTNTDPSFAVQQPNLDKTINGFYSCLLLQDLLTDQYLDEETRLYAPEYGFCGPAQGTTKEGEVEGELEWGEDAVFLDCQYPLCCGFAVPKGSSDPMTRVSTCSDQFIYSPERVGGYERTIGTEEWDFSCSNVDGAKILLLAFNIMMLSISVFTI